MKGRIIQAAIAVAVAAAAVLPGSSMAASTVHKDKIMKCPICTMPMPSRKAPGATERVRVGHHYYYCCAKCGYKGDKKPMSHGAAPMPHM